MQVWFKNKIPPRKIKEELGLSKSLIPDQVLQAVTTIFNQLRKNCKQKKIKFVYGKGKRKTNEQRDYELLKDWKKTRNLQETSRNNGRLQKLILKNRPWCNLYEDERRQHEKWSTKTILEQITRKLSRKTRKNSSRSGYESEENYVFLAGNKLTSYIKPSNYEKLKTWKHKKEQEFRESLKYDEKQDKYKSQEGKEFIRCNDRYRKRKRGYVTTKVYRWFDWSKEGQKNKGIYITETFQKYREESLKNIMSDQGIEERLNRSIQAEGAFSKIKSGLNYNGFHHRGKENIISEICILINSTKLK